MGNANGGGICAGSRELSAEEELDDAALLTEISIDDDVPGRKLSEKEFAEDLKKSLTGSLFSKHQEVDNMINSGNDQGLEMKSGWGGCAPPDPACIHMSPHTHVQVHF